MQVKIPTVFADMRDKAQRAAYAAIEQAWSDVRVEQQYRARVLENVSRRITAKAERLILVLGAP